MNRYVLSDVYPNVIYDKATQRHLSMTELLEALNKDKPTIPILPCKECWGETVMFEDIILDTEKCNFCDVPYCLFAYINKRFFK